MNVSSKKTTNTYHSKLFLLLIGVYPIIVFLGFCLLGFLYMQRSTIGSVEGIGAAGFGLLYYFSLNGISAYIVLILLYKLFCLLTKKKLNKIILFVFVILTIPCGVVLSTLGFVSPLILLYERIVFG